MLVYEVEIWHLEFYVVMGKCLITDQPTIGRLRHGNICFISAWAAEGS